MPPWILGPGNEQQVVFLSTAGLGSVCLGVYLRRCSLGRCMFSLGGVVRLLLHSGGLSQGVILVANTVVAVVMGQSTPLAVETFVGGVVVSVVTGWSIRETLGNPEGPRDAHQKSQGSREDQSSETTPVART